MLAKSAFVDKRTTTVLALDNCFWTGLLKLAHLDRVYAETER